MAGRRRGNREGMVRWLGALALGLVATAACSATPSGSAATPTATATSTATATRGPAGEIRFRITLAIDTRPHEESLWGVGDSEVQGSLSLAFLKTAELGTIYVTHGRWPASGQFSYGDFEVGCDGVSCVACEGQLGAAWTEEADVTVQERRGDLMVVDLWLRPDPEPNDDRFLVSGCPSNVGGGGLGFTGGVVLTIDGAGTGQPRLSVARPEGGGYDFSDETLTVALLP